LQNSSYKLLSAQQTAFVQPNYRTLFESVPGHIIAVTPALLVAAASKLFAYSARKNAEELYGEPLEQVNPFNTFNTQQLNNLKNTITEVFKSGKSITEQYSPAETGWSISFSVAINEHNEMQYVILQLEQLDSNIPAGVLNTIARLKEADRIKDEFLINVAHDLRAPMHVIGGYAQIVLSECGDKLDDTNRQYLEHIKTKAGNLGELVSALLEYTKVQAGTVEQTRVDMREIVLDALSDAKESLPKLKPAIQINKLPDAVGDKDLLHRVWRHLLSNALKYSAPKPDALIEIGYDNIDNSDAFYVKDNGVGFDPEYAHKLFNPFERLHNEDDFPGPALGLAVVRLAIEKQGGKVWAKSEENGYAIFCFTLPGTIKN
jgi:light-regulated signal transduction histidine kinase (bacteriophytochrome)